MASLMRRFRPLWWAVSLTSAVAYLFNVVRLDTTGTSPHGLLGCSRNALLLAHAVDEFLKGKKILELAAGAGILAAAVYNPPSSTYSMMSHTRHY
jgi:hypothetical protein